MKPIITITLNPAIDKSTAITALVADKKMKCEAPVFEPGGGGVNVARALKKLGDRATAIFLAGGYTGKFYAQLLEEEQIEMQVVETAQHTRENLVVLDKSANVQYRFNMPGPVIRENEWKQLLKLIEGTDAGYIVASGSVPQGIPADIFARIGAIAKSKGARYIVDSSGEPLRMAVEAGVYLVKPNLGELSSLAGGGHLGRESATAIAREIIAKRKTEAVVVSMGAEGALLVSMKEAIQFLPPAVNRKSTVGAGDSMVAGIVHSLSGGRSLPEAVQFGVATGTAATLNPGTELCRAEDAARLDQEVRIITYQE